MQIDENLKKMLQNKNIETLYSDLYGKKIFVYANAKQFKVFSFEEDKIYKLDENRFLPSDLEEFSNFIKKIIENFKNQNLHCENILEYKESIILKDNFVKNFFKNAFVLRQKMNKNLKQINLLSEAFNLLLSEQNQYKKNLKALNLSINMLLKNTKENLIRLDNIYKLTSEIKNERMNQNIYLLSILSSIFLPLNLIVGFFGMNTNNLFFKDNPYGTLYIFTIICFILILGAVFYRSKKLKELDLDDSKNTKISSIK
ncbi:magnesium transporter CorA family protein [Campylobacter sp. VicNov18]|uniref:CorA family divalent cation transporter n=1 Tax=Campylobacter bilis TaxID=2691918 RepID=UPI00130D6AE6|nr:CorA family divalent cation transporter [Campylobacter bilis]MPV63829.1 magnesium transporter CorA family protein [Campylobacter hepaticus]MBM0637330.1 magnesium transporter CorA family protein [Campylobacter bilis]MCC8278049.1 magnesium transporter CorA family protein [Campylobacter bilis]MCC8299553.1 magnesium transporter CorA family protein [Campylobacter bilis]MCC8300958.1 magnesium transporter CorA family protein [Campylobacter bilis]